MQLSSVKQTFVDLFRPVPEKKVTSVSAHVQDYLGTTSGSQAAFDLVARVCETIKMTTPCAEWACCAAQVQGVFDTSALALDLPDLASHPSAFVSSCVSLIAPSSDESRSVARRVKDVIYTGLSGVRTGAKAVLFAASTSCAALPLRHILKVNVLATSATLLTDCADLARDCLVLGQEEHSPETALLALTNVVKNIASVVAGVFVWISLSLPHLSIAPWLPALILASGLVFSVARVSSYFVEKMIVEPSARSVSL